MMKLRSRTGAGLPPSFTSGDGNKGPNKKCGAIFKIHFPSCQNKDIISNRSNTSTKKNKTKRKTSARRIARQQPRQKATAEQQRKATQGMSERQLTEEYCAVCESLYKQRSAKVCAKSCYSEDMRTKTTSNRDRRRRSDSNNSRKQRPSSRMHCLRD